jgi:hypothetical protein
MILIGAPLDTGLLDASAFGWAVASRWAGRIAIQLHQLGVIDISTERVLDGFQVSLDSKTAANC